MKIVCFKQRPVWGDELSLIVPKLALQNRHTLKKGCAFVASLLPSGVAKVYFEENLCNASMVKTYEAKALLAYGRLVQNLPTESKMTIQPDDYVVCGTIKEGRCNIIANDAFVAWVGNSCEIIKKPC